jgi:iron(III) transport system ATP-binding protein
MADSCVTRERPCHPNGIARSERFFSELNLFSARAANGFADTPLGRFDAAAFADGAKLDVAIRLSAFDVSETGGALEARVLSRRFLGVVELLELAVPGVETPVRARVRIGELPSRSRDIWVTVRPRDVLVFETRPENA